MTPKLSKSFLGRKNFQLASHTILLIMCNFVLRQKYHKILPLISAVIAYCLTSNWPFIWCIFSLFLYHIF